MAQITIKELKGICKQLQLYSTPELNDKIYLHYKGTAMLAAFIRNLVDLVPAIRKDYTSVSSVCAQDTRRLKTWMPTPGSR